MSKESDGMIVKVSAIVIAAFIGSLATSKARANSTQVVANQVTTELTVAVAVLSSEVKSLSTIMSEKFESLGIESKELDIRLRDIENSRTVMVQGE